ncbi:hypothetical protein MVEN_01183100 [Mycena venus]|uniref:Uncharacterized protein n=1 Tax=Mycena venus TaxID=2733690 RepID=A0A8H7CYL2_9AGAR|nr:hypothetical protein MVEN_01183100 [Mycena venus]
MSLHTDVVRAIGIWKSKRSFSPEEIEKNFPPMIEHVRNIPIVKSNITKYEVSYKVERLGTSLASDLGLKEAELTTVVLIEGKSHEKIREALTHPDYKAGLKGVLDGMTDLDNIDFFSAEFVTVI